MKIKFFQKPSLWVGVYKNGNDQPGQMEWSQSSIEILGVNFGKSILDNFNWDIISGGSIKQIHIWNITLTNDAAVQKNGRDLSS